MAKFKVGDKVRVREDLVVGNRYGKERFTDWMKKYKGKEIEIEGIRENTYISVGLHWTDEMLEEVKEDKMEKTFREVIADIKEGEVWVNEIAPIKFIRLRENGVLDFNKNEGINLNVMYRLQRKEYTFEEAFKAYEEGKEIESVESGVRFLKTKPLYDNGIKDCIFSDSNWREVADGNVFSIKEIRGKWYIND